MSPPLVTILVCFVLVGGLRFLRESPRQYVQFVGVLGFVAALVVSPWPIRNAIRGRRDVVDHAQELRVGCRPVLLKVLVPIDPKRHQRQW